MSLFNEKMKSKTATTNLAGGRAYKESPELELVSLLLTSFAEDKFYEKATDRFTRLEDLANVIPDKKFIGQAAIYTRTVFGMRSISHVLSAYIMACIKGEEWTKRYYDKVFYRPDDMSETLAYYIKKWKAPIPNSFKKGVALALARFSEYSLAKYRGESKEYKLVDLINICHPKATPKIEKLVKGELKSTDTWETKVSAAGKSENKVEAKKEAWLDLLKEGKLGYFALIRNINNILELKDEEAITLLKNQLVNEGAIKKSLVLPFRLHTAYKEAGVKNYGVAEALNKAMEISLSNVPKFSGKNLIAIDASGSMSGRPWEIATMFATALFKANPENTDIVIFSTGNKMHKPGFNTFIGTMQGFPFLSGGTDFTQIFRPLTQAYDRIFVLTDMQGWKEDSRVSLGYGYGGWYNGEDALKKSATNYRKKFNCDPFIYSFDLAGYGTLKFPESKVYCLAGFSEKIFDIVALLEEDRHALINKIKAIEI